MGQTNYIQPGEAWGESWGDPLLGDLDVWLADIEPGTYDIISFSNMLQVQAAYPIKRKSK